MNSISGVTDSNEAKSLGNKKAGILEKETRFAVVMYGGVSLAIYIYGVAKELYSMVRATARERVRGKEEAKKVAEENAEEYVLGENQLTPVEKNYRKLGEALKTKFVVDILSGTSAGGINAIYLAKALANGETVDMLKDIWISQGDVGKLINDKQSEGYGLEAQSQPASLMNSQRMYFYLLKAMHNMSMGEATKSSDGASPFVEELNLNITATDIRGLTVDLPVANAHVRELRFRNVFHFYYSTVESAGQSSNDFKKENNPFLAYVARCTSSFPFAFEPMQLKDVESVLGLEEFRDYKYKPEIWSGFYKDYEKAGDNFPKRSFGDGGYLDNKPFSYATEALLRRRADQLVDRKLIYIDPSPEQLKEDSLNGEKPDALQNVMAALLSIPRYEPIREDLERVVERNKLIERVNEIISRIDYIPTLKKGVMQWQVNPALWAGKYFDKELLDWYGIGYITYHQLRVTSVLENLQATFLRVFNWNENEKCSGDLNILMDGWRRRYYNTRPELMETHRSENNILFRLDLNWRMRRFQFLQNIIDALLKAVYALDETSKITAAEKEGVLARAAQIIEVSGVKLDLSQQKDENAHTELISIKRDINDAYISMRAQGRTLRSQSLLKKLQPNNESLQAYADALLQLKKYLEETVDSDSGETRLDVLSRDTLAFLQSTSPANPGGDLNTVFEMIEKITTTLSEHPDKNPPLPKGATKGYIHWSMSQASGKARSALGWPPDKGKKETRSAIQQCLSYYYDHFEYYDMLIFPIYYGTNVEESDQVEIVRISPEDATNLVNEKDSGKRKLAGTVFANFGAFFAKEWRENDMMWGRLDAAECLLSALLPPGAERDQLIEEIHLAILQEELTPRDEVEVFKAKSVTEKIASEKLKAENKAEKARLEEYRARYGLDGDEAKRLSDSIKRLSEPEKLTDYFRRGYQINREFPPRETMMAGSRAMRVIGNMLKGFSNSDALSAPAKFISAVGNISAGILAAALPNTAGNFLVAGYWVWLLYIFEILLVGAGLLLGSDDLKQTGLVLFGLTVAAHLFLTFTNNWLARRVHLQTRRLLRNLISIVVLVLVLGVLFLSYIGLLDLQLLKMPVGAFGEWLGTLIN